MAKDKTVSIELKLRRKHPNDCFKIKEHHILPTFKTFKLSEEEVAELKSKGCAHWVITKEEYDTDLAKAVALKKKQDSKVKPVDAEPVKDQE